LASRWSLAGCGGSPTANVTATATPTTYTNEEFGFSITHPARFEVYTPQGDPNHYDPQNELMVGWADSGTASDVAKTGEISTWVVVGAYKLHKSLTKTQAKSFALAISRAVKQGHLPWFIPGQSDVKLVNVEPAYFKDLPCCEYEYTYRSAKGTTEHMRGVALYAHGFMYAVGIQSTSSAWNDARPELERALNSFTILYH
jgi:hypothetical protein